MSSTDGEKKETTEATPADAPPKTSDNGSTPPTDKKDSPPADNSKSDNGNNNPPPDNSDNNNNPSPDNSNKNPSPATGNNNNNDNKNPPANNNNNNDNKNENKDNNKPEQNNSPEQSSGNANNNNNSPNTNMVPQNGRGNAAPAQPAAAGAKKLPPPAAPAKAASSGNNDESTAMTVGIAIAAVVGLLILCCVLACFVKSRKKKKRRGGMGYYADTNSLQYNKAGGGDPYFNTAQNQNWQHKPLGAGPYQNWQNLPSPGADGKMQQQQQNGNWFNAPPPPPPLMSSGEMSSNYSGPARPALPPPSPNIALGFNKSTFTYDELAAATNGFSHANLLGQGGFGYVHKGVLPNGKEVAVKSLKSGSGQGEREFSAEVEIISRVHHRHLVSLVGYCIAGGQRMLVYEFVSNGTMEYHLYGKGRPVMDWPSRMRIALGSAKGLAYLHEDCHPRIIHRDIKAANILIDENFEAMVADFGLAKLSSDNNTHVSTRVMGTFGYLAPEYASSGKLTEKSDVFSFGVMLLELITGKRPVDATNAMEDSLVDWARPLLTNIIENENNYEELVDARLENNYNPQEMRRMVTCAAASIRHSARKRPKMSQIVRALEGDSSLDDLNEGVRPGQSSIYNNTTNSTDYSQSAYHADMKKFRQLALGSEEFPSSNEYTSGDSHEIAPGRL